MANGTENKVRELQTKLYQAAKSSPTRRFQALYDKVHRQDCLWRAWVDVARNNGAPGSSGHGLQADRVGSDPMAGGQRTQPGRLGSCRCEVRKGGDGRAIRGEERGGRRVVGQILIHRS